MYANNIYGIAYFVQVPHEELPTATACVLESPWNGITRLDPLSNKG